MIYTLMDIGTPYDVHAHNDNSQKLQTLHTDSLTPNNTSPYVVLLGRFSDPGVVLVDVLEETCVAKLTVGHYTFYQRVAEVSVNKDGKRGTTAQAVPKRHRNVNNALGCVAKETHK